jgi:hypothetical protein
MKNQMLALVAAVVLVTMYHLLKEPLAELKYRLLRRWYFQPVIAQPSSKRFAIVVPFMDNALQERAAQLVHFVAQIRRQLHLAQASARIIVLRQDNDGDGHENLPFNRGQLLNQGTLIALLRYRCDYVILHDVDLIPDSELMQYYLMDPLVPLHLAPPSVWGKYRYASFIGGVLSVRADELLAANGYPNFFFGWGREDDALFSRLWSSRRTGSAMLPSHFWEPAKGRMTELEHPHFEDIMDAKFNFTASAFPLLQQHGYFVREGPLLAPHHQTRTSFSRAGSANIESKCVHIGYPGAKDGLYEWQQLALLPTNLHEETTSDNTSEAVPVLVINAQILLPPAPPCA